jgi:hypothetical protein
MSFQPESHLAKFDGERVEVHAVDAVADNLTDGLAEGGGAGLVISRADDGEFCGNAPGSSEEDVTGAASDVGHTQGEEGGGRIGLLELLRDEVVERVLDEGLNEFVFGIVGAGGGTFVALGEGKVPFLVDPRDSRFVFEKALIDGAKLFDIEGTVVHPHFLVGDRIGEERELAESAQEGGVVE